MGYRCLNCNSCTSDPKLYDEGCSTAGKSCGFRIGRFEYDTDAGTSSYGTSWPWGCVVVPVAAVICGGVAFAVRAVAWFFDIRWGEPLSIVCGVVAAGLVTANMLKDDPFW